MCFDKRLNLLNVEWTINSLGEVTTLTSTFVNKHTWWYHSPTSAHIHSMLQIQTNR